MFSLFSPKSDVQLHALIESALGVSVPTKSVCAGHQAPFSFVADSYFERVQNTLTIGPRTGGKTLDAAIIEFVETAKKPGCDSCHLGAIIAQAKRAYGYIYKWSTKYQHELNVQKLTRENTVFGNDGKIEILPGTVNGVNSPHPHKATIDEFELLDWEIFQEAISMPKSGYGINSALRLATTRKYPNGNAQKMIEEAHARGFKVYKWCVFEVLKPCAKKTCDDCAKYTSFDRAGKKRTWREVCGGKAKKADGYLDVRDAIKAFQTLDWETFNCQWLCERPEKSDAVFGEFNYDLHVIDSWQVDPTLPLGRGWDFGFDDPTAVLFFQILPDGTCVQFDELVVSGSVIDDIAEQVQQKSAFAPPEAWVDWGDPSGNARTGIDGYSYIGKLATKEIYVYSQVLGCAEGIQIVKKKLHRNNFSGKPGYLVTRNCTKTINALELSQWDRADTGKANYSKEKYRHDEHSHPLDGLRYFMAGLFSENEVSVS